MISFRIVLVGILASVFFTVLWQVGNIVSMIIPEITIFVNLDTFIIFLLIFLSSIIVSYLQKFNLQKSIIYGALIGFLGEIVTFIITMAFSILVFSLTKQDLGLLLSFEIIYYYLIPESLFQMITGISGALIPVVYNKIMKKKNIYL